MLETIKDNWQIIAFCLGILAVGWKRLKQAILWTYSFIGHLRTLSKRAEMLDEYVSIMQIDSGLSPEMRFTMDGEGRCIDISPSFLSYFGWTEKDLISRNWEGVINENSIEQVVAKWERAYEQGKVYDNKQYINHRDGTKSLCEVRAEPIKDKNGNILKFRGRVDVIREDEN